mgnify:FL=1
MKGDGVPNAYVALAHYRARVAEKLKKAKTSAKVKALADKIRKHTKEL